MKLLAFLLVFPFFIFGQSNASEIEQLLDQKSFVKAEKLAQQFLENKPSDVKVIELLGDVYGHQKKWDDAINQYEKLVELKPKVANYHYKYGGALGMKALSVSKMRALGIIGDVKEAFLTAAELDPNHIDTRWALVELYMQLPGIVGGSKSKAFKYAEELQNLSKVDGYLAKGYIYEYDNEPELAEKFYKLAITEGGSLTCFEKLTTLYEKENQPEKAIKNIQAAQDKHKRNALHYQIGKVAAEYNVQLQKGEQCLQIYIKNYSPADGVPKAWANYRLAQIYKHKGEKQTAIKFIDLAIAELPNIKPFLKEKELILSL